MAVVGGKKSVAVFLFPNRKSLVADLDVNKGV
jgi:hypothetical protein